MEQFNNSKRGAGALAGSKNRKPLCWKAASLEGDGQLLPQIYWLEGLKLSAPEIMAFGNLLDWRYGQ